MVQISDLTWEDRECLRFSLGIKICDDSLVCEKHLPSCLQKIESWKSVNLSCCNPFGHHEGKTKPKGCIEINLQLCKKLEYFNKKIIRPGQKLCKRCNFEASNLEEPSESSSQEQSDNVIPSLTPPEYALLDINSLCKAVGVELKITDNRPDRKLKQVKEFYCEAKKKIKNKLKKFLGFEKIDVSDWEEEERRRKGISEDFDKLMEDLKVQIAGTSDYRRIVQLLTLVPLSWKIKEVVEYFSVTKHAVTLARRLRISEGILATHSVRIGKTLPQETKLLVLEMYNSEEFSRDCPGKKQNIKSGKAFIQKKLLLCTIDEMYAIFKERHPDNEIGRSKFFELCPKWCVTAGWKGMHNVCVCKYHENFKLCIGAVGFKKSDVDSFMKDALCPEATRACYLRICEKCSSNSVNLSLKITKRIQEKMELKNVLDESEDDGETADNTSGDEASDDAASSLDVISQMTIKVKQWVSTDRPELVFQHLSFPEFCDLVLTQLLILIPHHYYTIEQAKYFKQRKESLSPSEVIVVLDFAENYTYTIQDEIQSNYFNKQQLSIHPACLYYKDEKGETKEKSFCYVSEDTNHDAAFVQVLLGHLTSYVKETWPIVSNIEYFSDGCGGQYKNCKNFFLLCKHNENFALNASWSFFATSHGKSSCDAVGGAVKRAVTAESLRRAKPEDVPIKTVSEFMNFCTGREESGKTKVSHFELKKEDILRKREEVAKLDPKTVDGTRSFHQFVPLSSFVIGCKRVSSDQDYSLEFDFREEFIPITLISNTFFACVIDNQWFPVFVTAVKEEEKELEAIILSCQTINKKKFFEWPNVASTTFIPFRHALLEAKMDIKKQSMSVTNLRDIGKVFTAYKKKKSNLHATSSDLQV